MDDFDLGTFEAFIDWLYRQDLFSPSQWYDKYTVSITESIPLVFARLYIVANCFLVNKLREAIGNMVMRRVDTESGKWMWKRFLVGSMRVWEEI